MIFRTLASIILLALLSIPSMASAEKPRKAKPDDAPTLKILPEYVSNQNINIDTEIQEWNALPSNEFSTIISGEYDYDWTGTQDLSANIKIRFSLDTLYILVQVTDNVLTGKKGRFKGDLVELWFHDPNNTKKIPHTGIVIDPSPLINGNPPKLKLINKKDKNLAEEIALAGIKLFGGYDFELAIPFKIIAQTPPVMGDTLNFCALVRDWDQDDPNEDEVAIATCPIVPKSPHKIAPSKMTELSFNLLDNIINSIMSSHGELLADPSPTFTKLANITSNNTKEAIILKKNFIIAINVESGAPAWTEFALSLPPKTQNNELELRDLNGDGYSEILIHTTEPCINEKFTADKLYILQFNESFSPPALVIQKTQQRSTNPKDQIINDLNFPKNAKSKQLTVEQLFKSANNNTTDFEKCKFASDHEVIPLIFPNDNPQKQTHKSIQEP